MENDYLFFAIPKNLDKGKTLFGLPADEIAPALGVFVLFLISRHELFGFFLAAAWFTTVRGLKTRYGDYVLPLVGYWWLPSALSGRYFRHTPSSSQRYWLY